MKKIEMLDLSQAQKRIYYSSLLTNEDGLYNIGGILEIDKEYNYKKLESAINVLIQNNDVFKIRLINDKQYFSEGDYYTLKEKKFNTIEEKDQYVAQTMKDTIELYDNQLFRFEVVKCIDDYWGVFVLLHHIIADGWTTMLIRKQLTELYLQTFDENVEVIKQINDYSYKEYLDKEKQYLNSDKYEKDAKYWVERLKHISPNNFYCSYDSHDSVRKKYIVPSELSKYLLKCKNRNSLLLTLFYISISKLEGEEDIVISLPVFNRGNSREKELMGMCTSNVLVRLNFHDDMTIENEIKKVEKFLLESLVHQKFPYNEVVKKLNITQSEYDSIYKYSFNYYNFSFTQDERSRTKEFFVGKQLYALQFIIKLNDEMLEFDIDYKTSEFTVEYIDKLNECMLLLLSQYIKSKECLVSELKIVSENFEKEVFSVFNNTEYPTKNDNLYKMFLQQVKDKPQKVALIDGNRDISFYELERLAGKTANYLRKNGVKIGDRIGVVFDHGFEVIVTIMALIKLGAVFVPIASDIPLKRIQYMVDDSTCKLVMTNCKEILKSIEAVIVDFGKITFENEAYLEEYVEIDKQNIVYIIYTSGSSGRPKGVMVQVGNLINYIEFCCRTYVSERHEEVMPFFTPISFDLTITSIFLPLMSGNTMVCYENDEWDYAIGKIVKQNIVTVLKLTPAHLRMMLELDPKRESSIKGIIVGGENLTKELCDKILEKFGKGIKIFNEYGPTEATVGCMCHVYNPEDNKDPSVPIGRPISNAKVYLLNENRNLLPENVQGEIFIGGNCVSKGYLNMENETEAKFLPDIYANQGTMYRTGDRAILRNGILRYLGRIDEQVKIRGYRIELNEIVGTLNQLEEVAESFVCCDNSNGRDSELKAFVVRTQEIEEGEIICRISEILPAYMVPRKIIFVDKMPLTFNGKIDKNKLLLLDNNTREVQQDRNSYSELEQQVCGILEKALDIFPISLDDNFYKLGGDSISGIKVINEFKKQGIFIKIIDLLQAKSVREIVRAIILTETERNSSIHTNEFAVVPPIMNYYFEQYGTDKNLFHIIKLAVRSEISFFGAKRIYAELLDKHEMLRLNYMYEKLIINPNIKAEESVIWHDMSANSFEEIAREIRKNYCDKCHNVDIEKSPLFMMIVMKEQNTSQVALVAHHLVMDAISWNVVVQDFIELLGDEGVPIESEYNSYKDWTKWIEDYSVGMDDEVKLRFWKNQITASNDLDKFVIETERGQAEYVIPKCSNAELRRIGDEKYKTKIETLLMGVVAQAIGQVLKCSDMIFENESHGRNEAGKVLNLSRTVGWFTNIFPVHIEVETELEHTLENVKKSLNDASKNALEYMLNRYSRGSLYNSNKHYIRFNYLGNIVGLINESTDAISFLDYEIFDELEGNKQPILEFNILVYDDEHAIKVNYNHVLEEYIPLIFEKIEKNMVAIFRNQDRENEMLSMDYELCDLSQEELGILFE